jgi:hypothetical protein
MLRAVCAIVTLLATAMVFAGAAAPSGDGGTLESSGFKCKVLDGDGNLFVTYDSELWAYQTKKVLRCVGDGAPARPQKIYEGGRGTMDCKLEGGFGSGSTRTKEWVNKVGFNGNSQLTCTVYLDA